MLKVHVFVLLLLYSTSAIWVISVGNFDGRQGVTLARKRQQPSAQPANTSLAETPPLTRGWNVVGSGHGGGVFTTFPQGSGTSQSALIAYYPDSVPVSDPSKVTSSLEMFGDLRSTLEGDGIDVTVPVGANIANDCPKPPCTSFLDCKPFYRCFFTALGASDPGSDVYLYQVIDQEFQTCYGAGNQALIQCPLFFLNVSLTGTASSRYGTCVADDYKPTAANWQDAQTDASIQTFIDGGLDTLGIYWPGRDTSLPFTQDLGRQYTKYDNFQCSLKSPCDEDIVCSEVGSRAVLERGRQIYRSRPAYFTMVALENINKQLSNQYSAIGDALSAIALDTFNIGDFFPRPDDGSGILGALNGLGPIFSLFSGFVPGIGPALDATGDIFSAVGSFLGTSIGSSADPLIGAKTFAPLVQEIYSQLLPALENAADALFAGNKVNGAFNITDMMANGTWVNYQSITQISDLESKLRTEILSRSINALWKTPTSNKMWVIFNDLQDDPVTTAKCQMHNTGPQETKYCADGGVYYAYNFIEDGDLQGHVDYPWGGQLLQPKLNIPLNWVTEASAKTYRVARQHEIADPFNVSEADSTNLFLEDSIKGNGSAVGLVDGAGRFPGSWTLPVCDTSTWGESWNWDYNSTEYQIKGVGQDTSHPPCLCGFNGNETDMWQKAAGMYNFETFHKRCTRALESKDFQWPEGVTSITYSSNKPYTVKKKGT